MQTASDTRRQPGVHSVLFRRPIRASLLVALACLLGAAAWAASGRLLNEHRFRAAQEAAAQRDFVRAAAYLATCVEAMPDSGTFRLLAAQTARRTHDFGLANEHLVACQRLAHEPRPRELAWTLLAAQTGRFAEHESFLRGLVEQDHPEASPILEVLIDGYIQHFNMRSALHCLDLYLEREPNNLQAWLGRGHVCERLFHWTGAVTAYRRAVDLVPEDYEARLRLASALIVVGPANGAAAGFQRLPR